MKKEESKKRKFGILYLILICLVILAVIYYLQSTMAQYRSAGTGTGTAEVALWNVSFSGDNSTWSDTYNMTFAPSSSANVVAGKIAPSLTATGTGYIDLTGTETAVDFTVTIGDLPTELAGANFTVTGVTASNSHGSISMAKTGSSYTGSISLPSSTTAMGSGEKVTFVVTVQWDNDSDEGVTDTSIGETLTQIEIPVNVTAVQKQ